MSKRTLSIQVSTLDGLLDFQIEEKATGKQLFDLVTSKLGVKEVWYFGLKYIDDKDITSWLKHDKKILDQNVSKQNVLKFHFRVKFYPEDVEEELIQEITQHLFYLQVKEEILNGDINCPVEKAVLLASYAVQAKYGDFDPNIHQPGFLSEEKLVSQKVMDRYKFTQSVWEEGIVKWYTDYRGMLRENAELQYLKLAQGLEMFGVHYYEVTKDKKATKEYEWWIGIDAFALSLYAKNDKEIPKFRYPWPEIKRVTFNGKKVSIFLNDKSAPNNNIVLYVSSARISDLITELCSGHADMYNRRRMGDTLEIQQMKVEKARKLEEKLHLQKEVEARRVAEEKKAELEKKIELLEAKGAIDDGTETPIESPLADSAPRLQQTMSAEPVVQSQDNTFDSEESKQPSVDSTMPGNEHHQETDSQTHHEECEREGSHTEAEEANSSDVLHVDASMISVPGESEEEQRVMERISQLLEEKVGDVLQATKKKEMEAQELKKQLEETKLAVEAAKMKLKEATGAPQTPPRPSTPVTQTSDENVDSVRSTKQPKTDCSEYHQQYKDLSEQLNILKTEMDDVKREDKVSTRYDLIQEKNVAFLSQLTILLSDT